MFRAAHIELLAVKGHKNYVFARSFAILFHFGKHFCKIDESGNARSVVICSIVDIALDLADMVIMSTHYNIFVSWNRGRNYSDHISRYYGVVAPGALDVVPVVGLEIISNKNQKPTSDWLNIVVSSKARSKIKQKLKEEENKRASIGKEIFERRLKNWKIEANDEILHALIKKYKYKTLNEFYSAIGDDSINMVEVKEFLSEDKRQEKLPDTFEKVSRSSTKEESSDYLVIDGKLGNVDYRMAKCCNPIFGDEVFGFVTIREGIKIHRISCPNAARLIESYPYRIQKVKWRDNVGKGSFQVTLRIMSYGDFATTNNIITTVNLFKASIRSFNVNEKRGEFEIMMLS
jgi:(p)ppGpp synthase/HD superfamily hydrolase